MLAPGNFSNILFFSFATLTQLHNSILDPALALHHQSHFLERSKAAKVKLPSKFICSWKQSVFWLKASGTNILLSSGTNIRQNPALLHFNPSLFFKGTAKALP